MKLPKIKKLPSGSWRMQLQIEGERYSIVDKDPKVVKQKAKNIIAGYEAEKRSPLTVGEAIDRYIKYREPKISPSTTRSYLTYRKNYLQSIMNINLNRLTQEDVDEAILEDEEREISPKTIRNAHGLLTATLKKYRPKFRLDSDLPDKDNTEVQIPTEEEMVKIWTETFSGRYEPQIEIAVTLAAWLGLRMSEILALKYDDISDGHVTIQRALVQGKGGHTLKGPKTRAGYRRIRVPQEILNMIESMPDKSEFVVNRYRSTVNKHFNQICDRAGVQRYRLHDLRHFSASEALSLNIPNKYQMKRMGHSTDYMLKRVYQHVMRDKEDQFFDPLDAQMLHLYQSAHGMHTKKIEAL